MVSHHHREGHSPSTIDQNVMKYRIEIWNIYITHKIEMRLQLPLMVSHHPLDCQPPFQGWSPAIQNIQSQASILFAQLQLVCFYIQEKLKINRYICSGAITISASLVSCTSDILLDNLSWLGLNDLLQPLPTAENMHSFSSRIAGK